MNDASPAGHAQTTIRLADYAPPSHLIDQVVLTFRLHPTATRVLSRIDFRRNPAAEPTEALHLDGEALTLISLAIDGAPAAPEVSETGLTLRGLPDTFTLEAEVEISPATNTALEGLYLSNGMFCTQCEAEGFRKITYYPDRPDVMAPFTVRIESDLPVLLSNGNPGATGAGFAEWHDPWPKPAYLFALVAGDLTALPDRFTTASGRAVDLNIWVRPGDEGKCAYAMDSLKRSMRWDETEYGREYDLDVFNLVAVDDFNMGAMENKGLNIFNSKFVLASPDTATDRDYDLIEGIVAHEYFHNWTGNRITCRDWFQLCLKEGLTVFRDQQFSADMRSAPVKRIEDVLQLRARQFREDAGPLAHNVRPEAYVEINNFYTATVYEKGAEVIGMLHTLVGAVAYRKALDLYFDRHDGQACTIEDWLRVFEDATGRDLSQFKRWYAQAGTPRLSVETALADEIFTLTLRQSTPATPGQPEKAPLVIPVRYGLLAPDGTALLPDTLIEMAVPEITLRHDLVELADRAGMPIPDHVIPSLLRGFSAPVILDQALSSTDRLVLLTHDTDPFNRWEAGRSLVREVLVAAVMDRQSTREDGALRDTVWDALGAVLADDSLDPAFRALVLSFPSEDDLAQAIVDAGAVPDPTRIRATRAAMMESLGDRLRTPLRRAYDALDPGPEYSPADAGNRALRNTALRLLGTPDTLSLARAQFATATNMTDQIAALSCLIAGGDRDAATAFESQWRHDRLVMDKWFMLCIAEAPPRDALDIAESLTRHALFDWQNPNRFRSLMSGLTMGNPAAFHDPSGRGYAFVADWLIRLDGKNPQTAARLSTAFETASRYDPDRQALIAAELSRIAQSPGLSRDLGEMVDRLRAALPDA